MWLSRYVWTDTPHSNWAGISTLLIELSMPACGYCGVLYNNRQLTCCFCSCNLFLAIWAIMIIVLPNIHIADINGRCEEEADHQQRRDCEERVNDCLEIR